MKTIWRNLTAAVLFAGVFTFTACQKDQDTETAPADVKATATDDAFVEGEFESVTDMSFAMDNEQGKPSGEKGEKDGAGYPWGAECVDIDFQQLENGKNKVIINFGTVGCVGADGKTRKGKIVFVFTGRMWEVNSYVDAIFDGYAVKRTEDAGFITLNGKKRIKNTSAFEDGKIVPRHKILVGGPDESFAGDFASQTQATVTFPNATTITWKSDRVREWTEGFGDFQLANDVFTIKGKHAGKNRQNVTYTAETVQGSPIRYKGQCFIEGFTKPVSGKVVLTSSNHPNASFLVDFGSGACDNDFTVTVQ
jgi:hypothetical protein